MKEPEICEENTNIQTASCDLCISLQRYILASSELGSISVAFSCPVYLPPQEVASGISAGAFPEQWMVIELTSLFFYLQSFSKFVHFKVREENTHVVTT